jgi:hypothetical protein
MRLSQCRGIQSFVDSVSSIKKQESEMNQRDLTPNQQSAYNKEKAKLLAWLDQADELLKSLDERVQDEGI